MHPNITWSCCSTNGQCAGSNVVALEPLDRTLMKSTALSASMDMAAFGISKASEMKRACMAVNHFLRERFPSKTWTSIAVLYNPSMPLHRDILNMIGHANHAVALGNFLEGRVWIEDENGQATTVLETKNGQKLLHGTWIDMHDAPVMFNARKLSSYCFAHQQACRTWLQFLVLQQA